MEFPGGLRDAEFLTRLLPLSSAHRHNALSLRAVVAYCRSVLPSNNDAALGVV
jgi:hypothetical protein